MLICQCCFHSLVLLLSSCKKSILNVFLTLCWPLSYIWLWRRRGNVDKSLSFDLMQSCLLEAIYLEIYPKSFVNCVLSGSPLHVRTAWKPTCRDLEFVWVRGSVIVNKHHVCFCCQVALQLSYCSSVQMQINLHLCLTVLCLCKLIFNVIV